MSIESIRQYLQRNRPLAIGIAVAIAVLAIFIAVNMNRPTTWKDVPTSKAFFIDDETNEVVVRSRDEIPPLNNDKGKPTLVRAAYFRCGTGAEKQLFYLEKYTPEIKAKLEQWVKEGKTWEEDIELAKGRMVRKPEAGSQWYSYATPEGQVIARVNCDGRPGIPANP